MNRIFRHYIKRHVRKYSSSNSCNNINNNHKCNNTIKYKQYGIITATAAFVYSSTSSLEDQNRYTIGNIINEDIEDMFQHGFTRLKDLKLNKSSTKICNNINLLKITNPDGKSISKNNDNSKSKTAPVEVTKGRFHLWLNTSYTQFLTRLTNEGHYNKNNNKSNAWKYIIHEIDRKLNSFVKEYFHHHGFVNSDQYVMTQLQLLISDPASEDQFFHVDNTACGLTFVIALDDIEMAKGPTELLYKSYLLHNSTGQFNFSKNIFINNKKKSTNDSSTKMVTYTPIHATLKEGEIFVFDSRTLHRGLGNISKEQRPVIIIRYDHVKYLPPGSGILWTMFLKRLGKYLRT